MSLKTSLYGTSSLVSPDILLSQIQGNSNTQEHFGDILSLPVGKEEVFVGQKLTQFLELYREKAYLFVKYPDISAFLKYMVAYVESLGCSCVLIIPSDSYSYNIHQDSKLSRQNPEEDTDTHSYFMDVDRDAGTVLTLTYRDLQDILKLSEEDRKEFMEKIGFVCAIDIEKADKKTLEILSELRLMGTSTKFMFHTGSKNYISNKHLGPLLSLFIHEEHPTNLTDLISEGKLQEPDFIDLEIQDSELFEQELLNELKRLGDLGRKISSIGYCKDQTQARKVAALAAENGFACSIIDTDNPSDIGERLQQLKDGNVDMILSFGHIGGELDIPFVEGVVLFDPPHNRDLVRYVLPAMQVREGKQGFVIDFKNWPLSRKHTLHNLIAPCSPIDSGRFLEDEEKNQDIGNSNFTKTLSPPSFPGVHTRLSYTAELSSHNGINQRNVDRNTFKQKSDDELIALSREELQKQGIQSFADIEMFSIENLRKIAGSNMALMTFLRRYGVGSSHYITRENTAYVFRDTLNLHFFSPDTYINHLRTYLASHGITDYATCVNHPLKKSRAVGEQKIGFREMSQEANLYYIQTRVLGQQNLSEFNSENRRRLAEILFPGEKEMREQDMKGLLSSLGIRDSQDLLMIQYRMSLISFETLKDTLNAEVKYREMLLSCDIYPSQLTREHIPQIALLAGFDISAETVQNELGRRMNHDLKRLGKGNVFTYCWDYIVFMEAGDFQKTILSQSPDILLYCKHFIDPSIKGSRITEEQKRQFADSFKSLGRGEEGLLYILNLRYKALINESLKRYNLSFSDIDSAKRALKISTVLKVFLSARHGIKTIDTPEQLEQVQEILGNIDVDY